MALIDMFELVHDMTYYGRNMVSVYHAMRLNAGEEWNDIANAWANRVLPALVNLQSDSLVNNEVRVFNLGDPEDFGTFSLAGEFGDRLGGKSPSFVAAAIRFPSLNRDVRSGQKRFPGLLESDYTAGSLTAAALALIDEVGDRIIGTWTSPVDAHDVAEFVIIKRVCKTEDPVTGKCLQYRLPEVNEELIFYQPTTHIDNDEVSSQTSRKVF